MTRNDTALLALSAALALAFGVAGHMPALGLSVPVVAAFKASGIVVLGVLALRRGAGLLAAGLFFGAAGDALLALQTEAMFLAGAGAFLIGHLCYITLFLRSGIGVRASMHDGRRTLGMIALGALAAAGVRALIPMGTPLAAPLAVYTAVLTLMAMASFTLRAQHWPAMAGAVLFVVSDAFVAFDMFHRPADPTLAIAQSFAGWMIYWAGQAGICVGGLGLKRR